MPWYKPAAQLVQIDAAEAEYKPEAQPAHEVEPWPAKVPAAQAGQMIELDDDEYVPTAQATHAGAPEMPPKVPAAQLEHTVDPDKE